MSLRKPAATPNAVASLPEQPVSAPMRFTKRFNVQITGTMANFEAEGPSLAQWRVPLGVNVSCIKGQEHTDVGDGYTFTALPDTHNPIPLVIFEADASAQTSQEWRRMYGEYNERNLDSHNVLPVANQNYVFVHENHPVISLLKANADLLGTEITDDKRIDGEWYKVSKTVLSTCCNTLKSKVLNKIAFNNLMDFNVSLKRLDAKEWTQDSDVLAEASAKNPNIIDKPCSFMARLEMTYELQSA